MKSILLMSILVATFMIPVHTARDPHVGRAIKKMVICFALFAFAYYFYVGYGHTRYFVPTR